MAELRAFEFVARGAYAPVFMATFAAPNAPAESAWRVAVKVLFARDEEGGTFTGKGTEAGAASYQARTPFVDAEDIAVETNALRLLASLRASSFLDYYGTRALSGSALRQGLAGTSPFFERVRAGFASASVPAALVDELTVADSAHFLFMQLVHPLDNWRPPTRSPLAVCTWLFQLVWSLATAQRVFGFTHRDIKPGNVGFLALTPPDAERGTAEEYETYYLEAAAAVPGAARLTQHFEVTRRGSNDTDFVPILLDTGLSSYYGERLNGELTAGLATLPSPDLYFYGDGERRGFASDLFSLGYVALDLLTFGRVNAERLLLGAEDQAVHKAFYVCVCRSVQAQRVPASSARQHVTEWATARFLLPALLLLDALGHSDPETLLPRAAAASPYVGTDVYGVLAGADVQQFLRSAPVLAVRQRVRVNVVDAITHAHTPRAIAFLRQLFVWHDEDTSAAQVLLGDYFQALHSAARSPAKRPLGPSKTASPPKRQQQEKDTRSKRRAARVPEPEEEDDEEEQEAATPYMRRLHLSRRLPDTRYVWPLSDRDQRIRGRIAEILAPSDDHVVLTSPDAFAAACLARANAVLAPRWHAQNALV